MDITTQGVLASKTITYQCGTQNTVVLIKDHGSWYLIHPDYSTRYTTKRAALAALEAL